MTGDSIAVLPGDSNRPARGRRLRANEKVTRDRAVVIDRLNGLSWPIVAQRNGLRERQCRAIFTEWRSQEKSTLDERDPVEWLEEALDRYEAIISRLALTAEVADNDAARVGALRAQMDAMSRQTELLVASGLLPRNLGVVKYQTDVRRAGKVIHDVLVAHGVSEEALLEIRDCLRDAESR
jgi:hypothetical protein